MARHSGRRTDYEWLTGAVDIQTFDLAANTKVLLGTIQVDQAGTLMRSRGELMLELDATAVNERVVIAVGIIKAGDAAVSAGSSSLPGPMVQGADDWLWHGYMNVSSGQEGSVVADGLFDRLTVDSKAMRKFKPDENFVIMAQVAVSNDQGGHATMFGGFRFLFGR